MSTGGAAAAGGDSGASTGGTDDGAAGAAGAVELPHIEITPSTLPNAQYHRDYSVALGASGGEAPYSWSVTSGSLPGGLALSATGTLAGSPTVEGYFEFEVTATDANDAEGTLELSLTIRRKRWLAYTCDEDTEGENLLTLVDVSKAAYPKSRVSVPAGSSVSKMSFSPNGHWLAYELTDADGVNRLYVLDVSGSTLAEGMRIGGPLDVYLLGWTPGGDAFSFSQRMADDSTEPRFVDLTSTLPPVAVPIPGMTTWSTRWVTDQLLITSSLQSQLEYTRRNGTSFDTARTLNISLEVVNGVAATGERINLVGGRWECIGDSYIVDFAEPSVFTLSGVSSVSTDLEWFTLPNATDNTKTDLYRYADLPDASPVATIPTGGCASYRSWAHLRPALYWVNNDGATPRVQLTELGSTIATREVSGSYTVSSGGVNVHPSPNDQWIAFVGSDGNGYLGPAEGEVAAISTGLILPTFSPDSEAVLFNVSVSGPPSNELYLLDWRSGTPGTARPVFDASMEYLSSISESMWSADSTLAAYKGIPDSSSGMQLYVVDTRDPEDTGTRVSPQMYCGESPCREVEWFAFQP